MFRRYFTTRQAAAAAEVNFLPHVGGQPTAASPHVTLNRESDTSSAWLNDYMKDTSTDFASTQARAASGASVRSVWPAPAPVAVLTPKFEAPKPATKKPAAPPLLHTNLHAYHVANKATMMPFSGWEMPLQYAGVFKEHLATRTTAGMFDVSHMGQVRFYGADREKFVEWVTVADVKALAMNQMRLAVILNEEGGILDDLMVTKMEDHIYCVINAGRRAEDLAYFREKLAEFKGDCKMEVDEKTSLIALQGPAAEAILKPFVAGIDKMTFMQTMQAEVRGMPVHISRCGYTGEDGFEIAVANRDSEALSTLLAENPATTNVGLGARDSLRLEAGMCLYGNDISTKTNLVEASLLWLATKRRREEGNFIGHEATMKAIENKAEMAPTRRVGIVSKGLCARAGAEILDADGAKIGTVTSGSPSPTLGGNVAMAYVDAAHMKAGTAVTLQVRNRKVKGEVVKLPFVAAKYKK